MQVYGIITAFTVFFVLTNVIFALSPEQIANISILANRTNMSSSDLLTLFNQTSNITMINQTFNYTIYDNVTLINQTEVINITTFTYLADNTTEFTKAQMLDMILRVNLSFENEKIYLKANLSENNEIYDSRFENIWKNYPPRTEIENNLTDITKRTDAALITNYKLLSDIDTRNLYAMIFMFAGSIGFTLWGIRKGNIFMKGKAPEQKIPDSYYGVETPKTSRHLKYNQEFYERKQKHKELTNYILKKKGISNAVKIDIIENHINVGLTKTEKEIDDYANMLMQKEKLKGETK